jgi:Xaa-Pro dipeptidase
LSSTFEGFKYPLPFDLSEYNERIARVKSVMKRRDIDVLILTSPENIHYLSAFQTPGFYMFEALVLPLDCEPFMVVREAEAPWVKARSWLQNSSFYSDHEDPIKVLAMGMNRAKCAKGRIAVEKKSWFLTVGRYERFKKLVSRGRIVDGSWIVENIRVVKSPKELEYMRQAAAIVDKTMGRAIDAIEEGRTENYIASEVYRNMVLEGSVYPGAHPYIVSGKRTGIMHANYENRTIERGDQVFLEIPACINRYHAAMMRTVSIGPPSDKVAKMAEASIRGLEVAIEAIKPERTSAEVDSDVREEVTRLGLGDTFRHRTAYSIGIAFPPTWGEEIAHIREKDKMVLKPGMVFHVILSLRTLEFGGVGFSESVAVTKDKAEVLGKFERRLFVK